MLTEPKGMLYYFKSPDDPPNYKARPAAAPTLSLVVARENAICISNPGSIPVPLELRRASAVHVPGKCLLGWDIGDKAQ